MRVLVVSDVHGRTAPLERLLDLHPNGDVIFLGDGLHEVEAVAATHLERRFLMVPGNCDWSADLPAVGLESFGGRRIFFTHGHRYGVKSDLLRLELAARERQAQVALFGHTHAPYEAYAEGLYLLNPGSLGYDDRYGYVDITSAGILTGLARLPR